MDLWLSGKEGPGSKSLSRAAWPENRPISSLNVPQRSIRDGRGQHVAPVGPSHGNRVPAGVPTDSQRQLVAAGGTANGPHRDAVLHHCHRQSPGKGVRPPKTLLVHGRPAKLRAGPITRTSSDRAWLPAEPEASCPTRSSDRPPLAPGSSPISPGSPGSSAPDPM